MCEWDKILLGMAPGMVVAGILCRKIKFKDTNQYCHIPWRLGKHFPQERLCKRKYERLPSHWGQIWAALSLTEKSHHGILPP